jgi:hypothetical protein
VGVAGYSSKVGKWCCGHGFMTGSNVVDVSLPCESNKLRLKWSERWLTRGDRGAALILTMPWRFVVAIWPRKVQRERICGIVVDRAHED